MNRSFDRVLLARHFALSVGAVAAYVFRSELSTGYVSLWIVGVSATLNFLAFVFQARPSMARFSLLISPAIGVGGWSALIAVTNGVHSPFIAGLWLEIVLSAMALRLQGVAVVTVASVVGLLAGQALTGFDNVWLRFILQSGFLVGMGLATFLVTRRWLNAQRDLDRQRAGLDDRLNELNRQLEDERVVAELGENVARLAHGLKNAVHSLRGFVRLIEPRVSGQTGVGPAIDGLRSAIDDLEELAHLTLGSAVPTARGHGEPTSSLDADRVGHRSDIAGVLRSASENVRAAQAGIEITIDASDGLPSIALSDKSFEEVLIILLRNAAEAMGGRGLILLTARREKKGLAVGLVDHGPGLGAVEIDEIFKPGYTTKDGGSGYGLFLARRIVEEHAGELKIGTASTGGARVDIWLPEAVNAEGGA